MSLLQILLNTVLFIGLNQEPIGKGLSGTWQYAACTYKNTRVVGQVTFMENGTFRMEATAHDDCPTPLLSGIYKFEMTENRFVTSYDRIYGISPYVLIVGDVLYFADRAIKKPKESWAKGYHTANWTYKLVRVH